jgi:hypothetical protein
MKMVCGTFMLIITEEIKKVSFGFHGYHKILEYMKTLLTALINGSRGVSTIFCSHITTRHMLAQMLGSIGPQPALNAPPNNNHGVLHAWLKQFNHKITYNSKTCARLYNFVVDDK